MKGWLAFRFAWVVMLTACGSATAGLDVATTTTTPGTTSLPAATLTTLAEDTGLEEIAERDVPAAAVFLAAVDAGLEGTVYSGDPLDDPETYLGTGALFCELLDDGLTVDEVLGAYVVALSDSAGGQELSRDDLLLGGVILGAGIEALCPEFSSQLEGGGE
ncbi:MAG: DUF732 domain-containing protein [Acidimicrobiia bacterium]|nr:DUF732 domain-containing protein [Acidimicrobiia bacterium]MDH4306154.1 DUF732 domain-containing protein [Acidimicrobiia bacterium]MDH5292100.1 DUF732 domain-containing protein [Acidimicrobiia bacterium]